MSETMENGISQNELVGATKKWVDLMEFDGETKSANRVARCVLMDGKVSIEGDETLVATLLKEGVSRISDRKTLTVEDGEEFLLALGDAYRSPYLFATPVQSGSEVKEYKLPPAQDVKEP